MDLPKIQMTMKTQYCKQDLGSLMFSKQRKQKAVEVHLEFPLSKGRRLFSGLNTSQTMINNRKTNQ